MDDSERFEQLIAFVGAQLPKPVEERHGDDGSFIFIGGDPAEVIVQVTDVTVLVASAAGGVPNAEPQPVGELHWRLLPDGSLMNALSAMIKGAREERLATYRVCVDCGERKAPELMQGENVCQDCWDASPGTVH